MRDGLNGFALLVNQRHTPGFFDAGNGIFDAQASIIARASYPQTTNRLLASVQNFCEHKRVSATLGFTGLLIAYGIFLFHAITVAHLVAQVKFGVAKNLLNH
ncbi:MAG: hypothetical protein ACREDS_07635 [Limisphaerales bacterium]